MHACKVHIFLQNLRLESYLDLDMVIGVYIPKLYFNQKKKIPTCTHVRFTSFSRILIFCDGLSIL